MPGLKPINLWQSLNMLRILIMPDPRFSFFLCSPSTLSTNSRPNWRQRRQMAAAGGGASIHPHHEVAEMSSFHEFHHPSGKRGNFYQPLAARSLSAPQTTTNCTIAICSGKFELWYKTMLVIC